MSSPLTPEPERDPEVLVRAYLLGQAERLRSQEGSERWRDVLEHLPARPARAGDGGRGRADARRLPAWAWAGGLAGAAALLLAFLGALSLGPARANAESLVRAARAVHALPVDRCYLVETERAAPADDSYAALTRSRVVRLRTRGDRFRIETESGQRLLHWGRDASGTIWLALSRHRGVRFESGEIPEALGLVCDVHSMRLETLLEDVLRDFDLRREEAAGSGGVVIRAELKAGREHPNLRSAVLELDVESKVIRRLVVDRQFGGRPPGTTTFTLLESAPQEDAAYQLEGHLVEPYQVYSRTFEPQRRRELLLLRHLGGRALQATPPPAEANPGQP